MSSEKEREDLDKQTERWINPSLLIAFYSSILLYSTLTQSQNQQVSNSNSVQVFCIISAFILFSVVVLMAWHLHVFAHWPQTVHMTRWTACQLLLFILWIIKPRWVNICKPFSGRKKKEKVLYAEANKKEKQASGSDVLGKQLATVLVKPESKPGNSCFLLLWMLQPYLFYSEEIDTTLTCLYARNEQPGE